jgi:hypothetical protein
MGPGPVGPPGGGGHAASGATGSWFPPSSHHFKISVLRCKYTFVRLPQIHKLVLLVIVLAIFTLSVI